MSRIAFLLLGLLPLAGFTLVEDPPTVEDLDQVIQARFGNLPAADIHQGRFGVSRVARPARRRVFVAADEKERAPLARLREEGWSASLYVLGMADGLSGPIRTSPEGLPAAADRAEVLKLGKEAIGKREARRGAQGEVRLEARPIPVLGKSCAGCHDPGLKEGDPLGAVIYVLRRTAAP